MALFILAIAVIVQSFANGIHCEVNNIVKSKLLIANQDLVEKNSQVVHATQDPILSRDEIFAFLARQVDPEEHPKLRVDFSYLTPRELVHIDILIYLMSQYKFAADYFQQAVFEIILEHERELSALMKNFT